MVEVRQGVDALDRALVALLAERQRYMDAAARIKPDRDAVHDHARIEDVVAKVLASAEAHHLSPDIAEPVWRTADRPLHRPRVRGLRPHAQLGPSGDLSISSCRQAATSARAVVQRVLT